MKRLSTSFQSASAAGMNYFDTLLVEPMAKAHGVPLDAARMRLAMREPDYLVAYMLVAPRHAGRHAAGAQGRSGARTRSRGA